MRKLILGITFLTVLISCKQESDKTDDKIPKQTHINPIEDPNKFMGRHKAKAMVLGVFHFNNPGLDSYKSKYDFNILEDKRQKELDVLLDKMVKYKPTKILVESSRIEADSILNNRFKKYINGNFNIEDKKNEVYQIAFKLAKKLGHKKVYASDASSDWFGVQLDWDNYDEDAYLKELGQFEKAKRYDYESFYTLYDSLKTTQSLTQHLISVNNLENRLKDHQAYLTETIIIGAGDNYLGADSVGKWYRRNLRIFANAYDMTDFDTEERLLLVYGSGHVWQLSQLFKDSPDFEYVEANEYLAK
ncbi:DUF5694 domain-containing protein [Maribacter cobaltidurans]|uniref:Uncharacterized protein n=1 Tax=Maribacter cobaltidurans TaxID=1178778 RepID=A0A223V6S9_9FLAO|nr:DUF5694 domain-containing protein [Maribacter cobaltidurans]ASV31002.1 hypothetical protein CJ263_12675 [Maribacter cobaltidurans]GGD90463.1 hypothetical protein GCM10011412_30470 [Maribacter cobaltidurans]